MFDRYDMCMMEKHENSPKFRFHGRRKGKTLTAYRRDLIDNQLQNYSIDDLNDLSSLLSSKPETWFEIGFGNGEFLSHTAQNTNDIQLIGCEPFVNGVAALLASLDTSVDNLKIWNDDARILMDEMPDHCLDRVYLLNPDPWPKTRHEKRRFIQTETLDEIARLLKPGGLFTMSTDVADLANWMHEKTWNHDAFEWTAKSPDDWTTPPCDWPLDKTRYMKKALGGETIYWLEFKRV